MILDKLDNCLPLIVSPSQTIKFLLHSFEVASSIFLGRLASLVSIATCTSPPKNEFVTTFAKAGLARIISGLLKTIFALIDSFVKLNPQLIPQ